MLVKWIVRRGKNTENITSQKLFDLLLVKDEHQMLLNLSPTVVDHARILAVSEHALSSKYLRTMFDNKHLQNMRLFSIFDFDFEHCCPYVTDIDELGHHGLLYSRGVGRFFRHSAISLYIKL